MRKAGKETGTERERERERERVRARAREEREASEMPMPMARHEWLAVGQVVELRSFESGFEGAWFKVIITRLCASEARVNYWYFTKKGPGERAHSETALLENLRPLPPQPERERVSWEVRDAVETRWMDAWWQGYIKSFDAATNKYRVYYGRGVPDLDIPGSLIRARLDWVPLSSDLSKSVWAPAENMQDPPVWVKTTTPVMKMTALKKTMSLMKTTVVKKRPVAQIRPRMSVPAPHAGDESESEIKLDGASWEVMEERRQKKKPRALSRTLSAPTQKLKFVCGPTAKITRALPAIKPPKPTSEQTTVCLTPGSSPPLAESPVQDFEISPGSDSQTQKPFATPEASPPTKASSISSGSRAYGSSNSTSSLDDGDDCGESEDGDHPAGEDVVISSFLHPFPDVSNESIRQCMAVYHQLLQCFLNDPKGYLDQTRERILEDIKEELRLPTDLCNEAHCAVFGLPPAFLNR